MQSKHHRINPRFAAKIIEYLDLLEIQIVKTQRIALLHNSSTRCVELSTLKVTTPQQRLFAT